MAWKWLSWYGSHTRSGNPLLMKLSAMDIFTGYFTWSDSQYVKITPPTISRNLLVISLHCEKMGDSGRFHEISGDDIYHFATI